MKFTERKEEKSTSEEAKTIILRLGKTVVLRHKITHSNSDHDCCVRHDHAIPPFVSQE